MFLKITTKFVETFKIEILLFLPGSILFVKCLVNYEHKTTVCLSFKLFYSRIKPIPNKITFVAWNKNFKHTFFKIITIQKEILKTDHYSLFSPASISVVKCLINYEHGTKVHLSFELFYSKTRQRLFLSSKSSYDRWRTAAGARGAKSRQSNQPAAQQRHRAYRYVSRIGHTHNRLLRHCTNNVHRYIESRSFVETMPN